MPAAKIILNPVTIILQLLDDAEHDMQNYEDREAFGFRG